MLSLPSPGPYWDREKGKVYRFLPMFSPLFRQKYVALLPYLPLVIHISALYRHEGVLRICRVLVLDQGPLDALDPPLHLVYSCLVHPSRVLSSPIMRCICCMTPSGANM